MDIKVFYFSQNVVFGHGSDVNGEFYMTGSLDPSTKEVYITKQYIGKHSVSYKGDLIEKDTIIRGSWTLKN